MAQLLTFNKVHLQCDEIWLFYDQDNGWADFSFRPTKGEAQMCNDRPLSVLEIRKQLEESWLDLSFTVNTGETGYVTNMWIDEVTLDDGVLHIYGPAEFSELNL